MKRGMINLHTALSHHFLDLTVADRICHIPAHAPQDDIALKITPFERDRHHPPRRTNGRIIYPTAARQKFATEPSGGPDEHWPALRRWR